MAAMAAAAASPVGPGTAGVARVSCGRDLSCVPEVAGTLGAVARQGFDFLCMPIFHPRYKREFFQEPAKHRPGPQTRSDLLLSGRDWNTLIVGKLSPWIRADSELEKVRRNSEAFWMRVPLLAPEDLRDDVIENEALQAGDEDCAGEEKTWQWWHSFRTLCDYNKRVAVALEVGPDLPSNDVINRWLGEPIKAAILPTSIFLTNKKGFPVLSKMHQRLIFRLLKVQFIITGAHHHPGKEFCSYLQYLEYLSQNRPPPSAYELFAKGYEDYLQSPLQGGDGVGGWQGSSRQRLPPSGPPGQPAREDLRRGEESQRCGDFRGEKVFHTIEGASPFDLPPRLPALFPSSLESWQYEEWGSQVTVVSRDMREWEAPEKADLMVSELLGSFADNELSPECLDGAEHCLKEGGVSIPCDYTSFLGPISSSKLYNEVRACREKDRDPEAQFEMPYVVRLHNFHQLAPPKACFSFRHPNPDPLKDNNRYQTLEFQVDVNTVLHGFAGYFETKLYGDVTLIMVSHPQQPMTVQAGEKIRVAFWRSSNSKKVWYEWAVVSPMCSVIHNPTGRSYTIGL
ncbi:hypothetical protein Chor_009659 [Crotalus horridus]